MPADDRTWLNGKQGIVSLTFDDGCESQLTQAIPIMERYGLRGTFYLNPSEGRYKELLPKFRPASERGHEMGNHTCRHRCTLALGSGDNTEGLERQSLESVELDILQAEQRLLEAFPNHGPRSFCYPCYNQHVGHGIHRQSYTPIIAKHFIAGRGGTPNRGHLINPAFCDLVYLEAQQAERMWGYEMVGLAEKAATQNRWLILAFHNVGGGYLSVQTDDFEELCNHLSLHKDRLHVAPVVEVAQQLTAARKNGVGLR